jgi:hypothetical protein
VAVIFDSNTWVIAWLGGLALHTLASRCFSLLRTGVQHPYKAISGVFLVFFIVGTGAFLAATPRRDYAGGDLFPRRLPFGGTVGHPATWIQWSESEVGTSS